MDASNLTCRYKASVVANNRLYAGNVKQNNTVYGDRMLKSPIGKYNILPASNFIDVAINDGDEITALAYYKDKILQFKKQKVFIINESGDYEFLENTLDDVGVLKQCSVTKTPHGIVWANKTGCYLYDGNQMVNLIDKKIPSSEDYTLIGNNFWLASIPSYDGIPIIGYHQERDLIVVRWQAADSNISYSDTDGAYYHFATQSWFFTQRAFTGVVTEPNTGELSNMITNKDGDILFYRFKSDDAYSGIKKWSNPAATTGTSSPNGKGFNFRTKDFTFGNIVDRKKIYKVYVTYKTTDGSNSKIIVHAGTNGGDVAAAFSASKSRFAGTNTACYSASNGLLDTGGDWKIGELRFTAASTFNNIYSFQLFFYSSEVDVGFQVNDISIVYKTKRTK